MREATIWKLRFCMENPKPDERDRSRDGSEAFFVFHRWAKEQGLICTGGFEDVGGDKCAPPPFRWKFELDIYALNGSRLIAESEAQMLLRRVKTWCRARALKFRGTLKPLSLQDWRREDRDVNEADGSPTLLTQAVIIPQGKSNQGILVAAVAVPWVEIIRMLEKDPNLAFSIDPHKWEEIIAGAYVKAGFDEVTLTRRSGDLGRDVIAIKRGIGCVRFIDSVKRYRPDRPVPADDVRALLGVLLSDPQATKGVVTTTSSFAPKVRSDPFIRPHIPFRLELVDGTELMRRLGKLARTP